MATTILNQRVDAIVRAINMNVDNLNNKVITFKVFAERNRLLWKIAERKYISVQVAIKLRKI
jgi:hypothetical protein